MASKMNNKKLDQTLKAKVDHVQKHNGIHVFWDKEGVWKKIRKALEDSTQGPKMIAWYTAMAASVSLLVASTVNVLTTTLEVPSVAPEVSIGDNNEPLDLKIQAPVHTYFAALPADSMVIPMKSRQLESVASNSSLTVMEKIPQQTQLIVPQNNEVKLRNKLSDRSGVKFHLAPGISANQRFVVPKLDIGVTWELSSTRDIRKKLFMGGSVQFVQGVNREQNFVKSISRSYFVKSSFTKESVRNGKSRSWSTGAEYLIHSEDDSLPGSMFRLFYNRSVIGKLKVGPEIMFTRGLKKVYPGITLAVG